MKSVEETEKQLDTIPEKWRTYWCEPDVLGCACLGCANKSKITKDEWEAWMKSQEKDDASS